PVAVPAVPPEPMSSSRDSLPRMRLHPSTATRASTATKVLLAVRTRAGFMDPPSNIGHAGASQGGSILSRLNQRRLQRTNVGRARAVRANSPLVNAFEIA